MYRRCVLGFQLPSNALEPLIHLQQTKIAPLSQLVPGVSMSLISPVHLVVKRFECLSDSDVQFVTKALHGIVVPSAFDVVLSGLLFSPSAKKARQLVVPVKHKVVASLLL